MQEALLAALTTVADACTGAIAGVLPIALPVMGAVVVVGLGVSIFKRFIH